MKINQLNKLIIFPLIIWLPLILLLLAEWSIVGIIDRSAFFLVMSVPTVGFLISLIIDYLNRGEHSAFSAALEKTKSKIISETFDAEKIKQDVLSLLMKSQASQSEVFNIDELKELIIK